MSELKLVLYPDPILNQRSEEVKKEDLEAILLIIPAMTDLTNKYAGAGLAAVQVGILKRFCIIKDSHGEYNLIINPEILETEDLTQKDEGCLSLPYFADKVERYEQVTAKFLDKDFNERTAVFTGIEAQCLQHEIGHMNGELLVDKDSVMKKQMYLKKLKKKRIL